MKKATINYWVDMITGVAFLFVAVTGLLRLFPEATVSMSGAGQPVILGISTSVWQVVHDWSGVVMAAGVGRPHRAAPALAHLHDRQAGARQRRHGSTQGNAKPKASGRHRRLPGSARIDGHDPGQPSGLPATVHAQGLSGGGRRRRRRRSARRLGSARSQRRECRRLHVRRRDVRRRDDDWTYGRRHGSENDASAGAAGEAVDDGTATATSSARVVVDAEACTGCGACVQVCPDAVFAMSGGKAVVRNADACRLCGRCTRVCAPAAITLDG